MKHPILYLTLIVVAAAVGSLAGMQLLPRIEGATAADETTVPGATICMYSNDTVLSQSELGQRGTQRLRQLGADIEQQLQQLREPLEEDISTLREQAGELDEDELESRQQELLQRQQTLQQQANVLNARLRYTNNVATQRINELIEPLVDNAYEQNSCSILLERDTVLRAGDGVDLTGVVLRLLDEQANSIDFDLLQLPQQQSDSAAGDAAAADADGADSAVDE